MKRNIYADLLDWKDNPKTPLIVLGARQVGKTYIIDKFCTDEYEDYIYINFINEPKYISIFNQLGDLKEFNFVISSINKKIFDIETTVIFLDEIQECPRAIELLKSFNESSMNYKIICAGSLLGTSMSRNNISYPVGKVKTIQMYPFTFDEFLSAIGRDDLITYITENYTKLKPLIKVIHEEILKILDIYLYIGGMPNSIKEYINKEQDILKYDNTILSNILNDYTKDMSKYTNNTESLVIKELYEQIPNQVRKPNKSFIKKQLPNYSRSNYLSTGLEWLKTSNIIYQINNLEIPKIPQKMYELNKFKLYTSDVGLFNSQNKLDIYSFTNMGNDYKDIIAENFVIQNLIANNFYLNYYKPSSHLEIDIVTTIKGYIIPIEVKYNINNQAKSLKSYSEKFKPYYSIKFSRNNIGYNKKTKTITLPLYTVNFLNYPINITDIVHNILYSSNS